MLAYLPLARRPGKKPALFHVFPVLGRAVEQIDLHPVEMMGLLSLPDPQLACDRENLTTLLIL